MSVNAPSGAITMTSPGEVVSSTFRLTGSIPEYVMSCAARSIVPDCGPVAVKEALPVRPVSATVS